MNGVAMAVSFVPIVGPILSCVIDGTFVDMWDAIRSGDWATLGMCALSFVPGGKTAKIGLKAVGAAKGLAKASKNVDVYRYVNKKGLDKALSTGKIGSESKRGIFVTTYKTGSASDALSKVTPLSTDVPVARLHGRVCLDDFKLGRLDESDIVDPDVTQYLLASGPDIELLDWLPLGP